MRPDPCIARSLLRAFAMAPLLAAGSCITTEFDAAPMELQTTVAVVRGHREQDVRELQALAQELDPLVRALVRPRRPEQPRIVVQSAGAVCCADACTTTVPVGLLGLRRSRFIVIRDDAPGARRFLLAHELAHWYADWAWDYLPLAIEEGLADAVAMRLAPEFGAGRMAFLAGLGPLSATDVRELLRVERGDEYRLAPRAHEQLYLAGRQVVEALGVDQLRSWCDAAHAGDRARIPLAWFDDVACERAPQVAARR